MTVEALTAILLIVVPVAFNLAFFELGRAFDYPDILRQEPDEILRRFAAGGRDSSCAGRRCSSARSHVAARRAARRRPRGVAGADGPVHRHRCGRGARPGGRPGPLAVRRPGACPPIRRGAGWPDGDATRALVEVVFATLHRLLGVGIGEHLGYLLTGLWTLLVSSSILSTAVLPAWLGLVGLPIGVAMLVGTLEFVGPNERDGGRLAGTIVPIAYIAWSIWLIALGVFLLI